jgi:predicted RecB family endonuclease
MAGLMDARDVSMLVKQADQPEDPDVEALSILKAIASAKSALAASGMEAEFGPLVEEETQYWVAAAKLLTKKPEIKYRFGAGMKGVQELARTLKRAKLEADKNKVLTELASEVLDDIKKPDSTKAFAS